MGVCGVVIKCGDFIGRDVGRLVYEEFYTAVNSFMEGVSGR
ncbi:hypothetical protein [Vulcanisaeta sp. JCM 16161]